jgi:hypothetical protein
MNSAWTQKTTSRATPLPHPNDRSRVRCTGQGPVRCSGGLSPTASLPRWENGAGTVPALWCLWDRVSSPTASQQRLGQSGLSSMRLDRGREDRRRHSHHASVDRNRGEAVDREIGLVIESSGSRTGSQKHGYPPCAAREFNTAQQRAIVAGNVPPSGESSPRQRITPMLQNPVRPPCGLRVKGPSNGDRRSPAQQQSPGTNDEHRVAPWDVSREPGTPWAEKRKTADGAVLSITPHNQIGSHGLRVNR